VEIVAHDFFDGVEVHVGSGVAQMAGVVDCGSAHVPGDFSAADWDEFCKVLGEGVLHFQTSEVGGAVASRSLPELT
jgi:hypothetical protein